MENTIIIGYAGGYCEIRLNHTEYGVTLEYLEMNEDHSDYVPDPHKPIQTFDTAAEAWIAVGKEIGWISSLFPTGLGKWGFCPDTQSVGCP